MSPPDLEELAAARAGVPGAVPPARRWDVDSWGLRIAVHEWGRSSDPPLLLAHGGFDFARSFDVFAPLLACAGWRVIAWDHRGHGDSDHAALYTWDADVRDLTAVIDALGDGPFAAVGHSKGGALLLQLAAAAPHRISRLVTIDGLQSHRRRTHVPASERPAVTAAALNKWLDRHRWASAREGPPPRPLEELARRRAALNPRLPIEWLRYLVTVGGRATPEGWRWKIDPLLAPGDFRPCPPEWSLYRLPALDIPFVGILGSHVEELGWRTRPEDVEPFLPEQGRIAVVDDAGHFLHIERPTAVAELVLEGVSA